VICIDLRDTTRAKERVRVRVLVGRLGAEPVSLDPDTGTVCVAQPSGDENLTLRTVEAWLRDSDVAVVTSSGCVRSFTMIGTAA
jgi:hypothetical protein